jgi:hypothetical protein
MKTVAIIFVTVAIAAGAVFMRSSKQPPAARNASVVTARDPALDSLKREVASLRAEMQSAEVNRQVVYIQSSSQAGSDTTDKKPSAPQPPPTTDELRAKDEQRRAVVYQALETQLGNEAPEPRWAFGAARDLEQAVISTGLKVKTESVTCAATLCRLVVNHPSLEEQTSFASTVSVLGPFKSGVIYRYDKDQVPPRTTLYVMREGQGFPNAVREAASAAQ